MVFGKGERREQGAGNGEWGMEVESEKSTGGWGRRNIQMLFLLYNKVVDSGGFAWQAGDGTTA